MVGYKLIIQRNWEITEERMFLPELFRCLLSSLLPKITTKVTGNITKFSTYDGIVKLRLTESISGLRDYDLVRLVRSKLGDENISGLIYSGKCDDERNYFIIYNPNRAKLLKKVTQNGWVLQYASDDVAKGNNDKDVVLAAVTQYGEALEYASDELKNDKEVVLAAVTRHVYALGYASDELKNDKEVVLAAVTRHGYALRYASPVLRADKEVVLAAVTKYGHTLQYASDDVTGGNNNKDVLNMR